MWTSLIVLMTGALLVAASGFWVLRAYRRAGGDNARAALAACAAVGLLALGAYLATGQPDLAGAPFQQRLEALRDRDPTTFSAGEALAVLNDAARRNPDDPLPHFFSGQVLLQEGRGREAASAFDAALRRAPQHAESLLGLGRAMVLVEEGRVTPEALAVFEQASALTDDPAPWIYMALGATEMGRMDDARGHWREALARMADDDPRREMAQRMISGQ